MAGSDDNEERTEQATEKHLREAREKGDVPSSQDLSAALVVLGCVGAMVAFHGWMGAQLRAVLRVGLAYSARDLVQSTAMVPALAHGLLAGGKVLLVPAAGAMVGAALAPVIMGSAHFSVTALQPKPERLDPTEGLKRMVSLRSLMELAKSILKVTLVGGVLALVLWGSRERLLATARVGAREGIAAALGALAHATLLFGLALGAIALVDVVWQRFDYAKRMRMTRQEIRDEMKDTEGDPQIRGRIRKAQRALARRRMLQAVPKANVVVANPTHFAVAVRYDEATMRAPRVVAKGLDLMAGQIRAIAGRHGIPVVAAPALARGLYHTTRVDQEIPAELYAAVAQVLSWVFRARRAEAQGAAVPDAPDPEVAPELLGPYRLPESGGAP
ncbi:MAG TPA: flagellar biosynthesis protein FlhB [Rhodanobacteraceae bacterium]|nr:flagellar biosynthesis protein FlhB [Rhodanobacteraceae bacterium]